MPRRTRKELVEKQVENFEIRERDEECHWLRRELRSQWRLMRRKRDDTHMDADRHTA